ncbi:MAG: MOSC N-terminal beta barrel domain-containing protein [Burkholderiales bacterium]|nr:MOSC N-terminal beta barrel domain-containing protein [Burkholderiales bacterium]
MSAPPPSCRVAALYVYPIKSCAGIAVDTLRFDALGPLEDRRWMLVDDRDEFVTQRDAPRLAMVRPSRLDGGLRVLAPGMPALTVAGTGGARRSTRVWDDRCAGFDEGTEARAWFSEYIGRPVRLLRFDASAPREASRNWVGPDAGQPGALTRFSDGFPLLVVSGASLAALNGRLAQAGLPAAQMQRFRPNVVLEGLDAFGEDALDTLAVAGGSGPAPVLRIVKPCTRCTVPEVDPLTGRHEPGILQVLAGFRSDPKLGGAVTFGQNAILVDGIDGVLRAGDTLLPSYRWD